MGDKYAFRGGGLPTKFNQTKNKLKIVIFLSLMLVLLIRNSAPFGRIVQSAPSDGPAEHNSIVVGEADVSGAYSLQNEVLGLTF